MEPLDVAQLAKVRGLTASGAAKAARLGARVTLREVAAASGLGVSTICRYERGERVPRGAGALRYLAVLEGLLAR
jgi:transcriptional regulator with XRE-family HTH domain